MENSARIITEGMSIPAPSTFATADAISKILNSVSIFKPGSLISLLTRYDDEPKSPVGQKLTTWLFNPDTKSAVCNFQSIVRAACENVVMSQNPNISVMFEVNRMFYEGLLHEIYHASSWFENWAALKNSKALRRKDHLEANIFARREFRHLVVTKTLTDEDFVISQTWIDVVLWMLRDHHDDVLRYQEDMIKSSVFGRSADHKTDYKFVACFMEVFSTDIAEDKFDTSIKEMETKAKEAEEAEETDIKVPETSAKTDDPSYVPWQTDAYSDYAPPEPIQTENNWDSVFMPDENPPEAFVRAQQELELKTDPFKGLDDSEQPTPRPLTPDEIQESKAIIQLFYKKMCWYLFKNCECVADSRNPIRTKFRKAAEIMEPYQLTPEESKFIIASITEIDNKACQYQPIVNGILYGRYKSKDRQNNPLPGYDIKIRLQNGQIIKRLLLPQNPMKTNSSGFTSTALEVQRGKDLMWIIDPDTKLTQFSKRVISLIYDPFNTQGGDIYIIEENEKGAWSKVG